MQLGDQIHNEACCETWEEISDFLIKYQYKQPKKLTIDKDSRKKRIRYSIY